MFCASWHWTPRELVTLKHEVVLRQKSYWPERKKLLQVRSPLQEYRYIDEQCLV